MPGLGTVINVAAILLGGLGGLLFGRLISEGCQETLTRVCGVCVIFIGMGGALSGMLSVEGGHAVQRALSAAGGQPGPRGVFGGAAGSGDGD